MFIEYWKLIIHLKVGEKSTKKLYTKIAFTNLEMNVMGKGNELESKTNSNNKGSWILFMLLNLTILLLSI